MKDTILNALGEPLRQVILGSDGEPMILNAQEQMIANYLENEINKKFGNALGYEINITTLTTIVKKVSEQKFFHIAPAKYVPIRVGEGAWSTNLTTYRSFFLSDDFATGVIDTGANNSRLAQGDAGVDAMTIKVLNWGKATGWSIFDLQFAAKSGNWDLVTAKEKARKTNWDLGIQKVAFLGLTSENGTGGNCLGLFNQAGITINTTRLTQSISALATSSSANLSTFIQGVLNDYRSNCNRTAWPNRFVIPESDYLGLAAPSSPTYPIKSILQLMLETFQVMTGNPNFEILPCAYGDKAYSGASVQYYALYNADEESIRMDIPVDYTNTLANSLDNFNFQNVGYGQFTGVLAYRPLELLYYQF